jgi:hypothetical protein
MNSIEPVHPGRWHIAMMITPDAVESVQSATRRETGKLTWLPTLAAQHIADLGPAQLRRGSAKNLT